MSMTVQNEVDVISNLKELLGLKKDKELCDLLEIKQNTISTWKKRKTLDYKKIIELCGQKELPLEEIFFTNKEKEKPSTRGIIISDNVRKLRKIKLQNSNRNLSVFTCTPVAGEGMRVLFTQRIMFSKLKNSSEYIMVVKKPKPRTLKCFFIKYGKNDSAEVVLNSGQKINIARENISTIWAILDEIVMD